MKNIRLFKSKEKNSKLNKNSFVIISILIIVMIFAVVLKSDLSYGDEDEKRGYDAAFSTEEFNVEANIKEDNQVDYKENIKVDFFEPKHGIYRTIPVVGKIKVKLDNYLYDKRRFARISDEKAFLLDNGKIKQEINDSTSNNGTSKINTIRIGSGDYYLEGKKEYQLQYKYSIYQDDYKGQEILYLNLLPSNWQTNIKSSKVKVVLPKEIKKSELKFYYGKVGSQNNIIDKANITTLKNGKMSISIKLKDIDKNSSLTIYSKLPKGYFKNQLTLDQDRYYMMGIAFAIMLLSIILWFFFGRDPKMIRPVEFYPPDGIDPVYAGFLVKNKVKKNDLSSLYLYMANKGYMEIEYLDEKLEGESKKDARKDNLNLKDLSYKNKSKNQFDKKIIKFKRKVNSEALEKEPSYVRELFDALFEEQDEIRYSELPSRFWKRFFDIYNDVLGYLVQKTKHTYTDKSIFSSIVIKGMTFIYLVGVSSAMYLIGPNDISGLAAFIILFVIGGFGLSYTEDYKEILSKFRIICNFIIFYFLEIFGIIILAYETYISGLGIITGIVSGILVLVIQFFQRYGKARTKKSTKFLGRVLGFKNYLEVAEEKRLKVLAKENPAYFYDILPYAQVFGIYEEWIEKFKTINVEIPRGYSGDIYNIFWIDYFLFNSDFYMSQGLSDINLNISNDLTNGFNGSTTIGSGGGFSGGGFGGGGGGAW